MTKKSENLIKIDDVIEKAKERGVDFGNADPRSRLRYYAKLDLIPSAERKVFEGSQPVGAYPEDVVDLLVEIDEEIKQGKSIKQVAEEKEQEETDKQETESTENQEIEEEQQSQPAKTKKAREDFEEDRGESSQKSEVSYQAPPFTLIPTYQKEEDEEPSQEQKQEAGGSNLDKFKSRTISVLTSTLKFAALALLIAAFGYTLGSGVVGNKLPNLSASLLAQPLTQTNQSNDQPTTGTPSAEQQLFTSSPDPYLTINVETDFNAPLNLTGGTSSPTLSFQQDGFEGILTTDSLTADRNYNLPDQSGTVCLSSGNCVGAAGEVTSPGGTANNLAKFSESNTIVDSSFQDLYDGGSLVTATEEGALEVGGPLRTEGNVGIGVDDPDNALDVSGTIYASDDVCIDGKCLSETSEGTAAFFGGGGGIDGEGSGGYLTRWTSSDEVGNSEIYQSGSNIGIGNTSPSSVLDIDGTVTMTGFKMPTNATSGYVLTAATSGVGTWQEVSGLPSGTTSQTVYYDGEEWATSSLLTNTGTEIGIGTTSPDSKLTVVGTTTSVGNFLVENETSLLADNSSLDSSVLSFTGYYDATSSTTSINATSTQITLKNITNYDSGTGSYRLGFLNNNDSEILSLDGLNQRVGIGTTSPNDALSVQGDLNVTGTTTLNGVSYTWPSSDGSTNQVLETNGAGSLAWTDVEGTADADWYISTSTVDGSTSTIMHSAAEVDYVGINNNSPTEALTVDGSGLINGQLTIATSGTSQLNLENGTSTLEFLVNATNSKITSSGELILGSSGEVSLADGVSLLNATNATVSAATFESADASVRSSDEYVLRANIPLSLSYNAVQTASSSYVRISERFSTSDSLSSVTPDRISGATRTYAFLINYADEIPTTSDSEWRVYRSDAVATSASFSFSGQDSSLDKHKPHLTNFHNVPDNDWELQVNPQGENIRISDILLLVYDKVE